MSIEDSSDLSRFDGMKFRGRGLSVWLIGLTLLIPFLLIMSMRCEVTVSNSPNGKYQIAVYQTARFIDRNFDITLLDQHTGRKETIYRSNDQSPTIKSERFLWSADSSKVVLLGDSYYVDPGSELPNGETVFLMYDLVLKHLFCNADYANDYERIPADKVTQIFGDFSK
jgi:hypothetical protein